jgi:type 1 glutamine amidotransferase
MRKPQLNNPITYPVLWVLAVMLICSNSWAWAKNPKVLIFCKTTGYHHQSIAAGITAIQKLGAENKFDVDTTTDVSKFTTANLKQYAALIFLSPTGKGVFKDSINKEALKQYIHNGGGFVGVHAATDFEYDWSWYGNLVGGFFKAHPKIQEATIDVVDANNIATKHLPDPWKKTDEWYHFYWLAGDLHVLLNLEEAGIDYGAKPEIKMGANHPIAWYHDFEGGHSFYTGLGHTDESYTDPLYLQHLLGGIKYAMGKKYIGK